MPDSISSIYVRNDSGANGPAASGDDGASANLGTDFIQRFNTNREIEIFGIERTGL